MEELRELFRQLMNDNLIQITLSGSTDQNSAEKAKVRPVLIGDKLLFQETLYRGTQVFHTNLGAEDMADRLAGYMEKLFR